MALLNPGGGFDILPVSVIFLRCCCCNGGFTTVVLSIGERIPVSGKRALADEETGALGIRAGLGAFVGEEIGELMERRFDEGVRGRKVSASLIFVFL